MSNLKEIRLSKGLTQKDAASRIGISLRSYISYENDVKKAESPKYRFILSEITKINPIDENHGILSVDDIRDACKQIFPGYEV